MQTMDVHLVSNQYISIFLIPAFGRVIIDSLGPNSSLQNSQHQGFDWVTAPPGQSGEQIVPTRRTMMFSYTLFKYRQMEKKGQQRVTTELSELPLKSTFLSRRIFGQFCDFIGIKFLLISKM